MHKVFELEITESNKYLGVFECNGRGLEKNVFVI